MDSNHRRYKPADLQSAPFGHSGIHPKFAGLCAELRCKVTNYISNVQIFLKKILISHILEDGEQGIRVRFRGLNPGIERKAAVIGTKGDSCSSDSHTVAIKEV